MATVKNAALHTLWQAAVASGGLGEIAKSLTDHSVNVPGLEQAGLVAGVAVVAAALSLAKAAAIKLVASASAKSKTARETEQAVAAIIRDYKAQHAATSAAVAPAVVVPHSV